MGSYIKFGRTIKDNVGVGVVFRATPYALLYHLPSVASRTTRRAFWLLSIGLHLWDSYWEATSAIASCLLDLNWALQRSHTPITGGGDSLTIRNRLFAMTGV